MIIETKLQPYLPFWEHLTPSEKSGLCENTNLTLYRKGQPVHRGDNDCIGILLVDKGKLRTYMLSEDGREITLFHMQKGDVCVLSASCILSSITFDVYIDAETDTEIFQINTNFFQSLTNTNVYAENFMYKVAMERFSDVMWVMEQVIFMSIDKRLAIFLLDEKDSQDKIYITHDQIARHIGTAREVVSRMLKYFSSENYVSLSRGVITITDKESLLALV